MSVLGDIDYTDDAGRIVPGALAHLTDEPETAPDLNRCKIPGCGNESAGKRGSWVGLCAQHISEEARRRQSIRADRKPPTKRDTPAHEKGASPAAKPIRVDTPQKQKKAAAPPGTLTDLARSVDTAAAEVREARGRHERAVAALRAALDAHDE